MTELEDLLLLEIEAAELPAPECQYKFHGSRKWKADFAWPCYRVIAEVNGGTYQHMGHTTGAGVHRDYEKQNAAQLMGYIYLEFDRAMIEDGTAVKTIQQAIDGRQG